MEFTTLCYIEKDGAYLMLHRVRRSTTLTRENGLALEAMQKTGKARRIA